MHDKFLTNRKGAFRSVSTYVLGVDADGFPFDWPSIHWTECEATGVIPVGTPVILVAPTATAPLRVAATGVSPAGFTIVGVTLTGSTAAGQPINVCVGGFCHVFVSAATPAALDYGIPSATAGALSSASAAPDATTVVGSILGQYLGVKGTVQGLANMAPFWFNHV